MRAFLALLAALTLVAADAPQRGFEDVTARAGVAVPHHNRQFENPYAAIMAGYTALGAAVAVGDYDGDGWEDIFVTDSAADGKNHLYHNNGNFTFTDVAAKAGVAEPPTPSGSTTTTTAGPTSSWCALVTASSSTTLATAASRT